MKDNSKIREGNTTDATSKIMRLMYRTDISEMFHTYMLDNDISKDELILIRAYVEMMVLN